MEEEDEKVKGKSGTAVKRDIRQRGFLGSERFIDCSFKVCLGSLYVTTG
jgi:hypothetical protein